MILPGAPFAAVGLCEESTWEIVTKFDKGGAMLADRHYSRRTVGSAQFMPPGQTLVLATRDRKAIFGWWRPHPDAGITPMNGLDGWTCTIFRNESRALSSALILQAESRLSAKHSCGPDGLLTCVFDSKVKSVNPGFCFKRAGWVVHPRKPRSADGRKTLLWKSFDLAGVSEAKP